MLRRFALLCSAVVFVGCVTKSENSAPAADTGMAATAAAPAPAAPAAAPMTLASVAGKYHGVGRSEKGDSILYYDLDLSDTTGAGWVMMLNDRKDAIKQRVVSVSGDSIVVEAGPYSSALRKGTMVTTHTVYRMENGKLVGKTIAHYAVKTPDSVTIVMLEATKK
jgi:hypothetical protein